MKKTALYLLLAMFMVSGSLQIATAEVPEIESFKAGGISINIPPPAGLIEVGYDVREQMEIFVNTTNRLLSAYMISDDIPRFVQGDKDLVLSRSACVQVLRQNEYQSYGTSDFNELVDYMKSSSNNDMASITEETEAEFNRRMESMNLGKMSITTPIELGTLFSKPDAYSFGMISTSSDGSKSWTIVVSTTFVRVRDRIILTYLTAEYKDDETIATVRKTSEEWADAILAVNK